MQVIRHWTKLHGQIWMTQRVLLKVCGLYLLRHDASATPVLIIRRHRSTNLDTGPEDGIDNLLQRAGGNSGCKSMAFVAFERKVPSTY
jgi:hypothetical protein